MTQLMVNECCYSIRVIVAAVPESTTAAQLQEESSNQSGSQSGMLFPRFFVLYLSTRRS
jgi:hypothetical protein